MKEPFPPFMNGNLCKMYSYFLPFFVLVLKKRGEQMDFDKSEDG